MITLTTEQAQQIEEALVNLCNSIQLPTSDVKALSTIRAARAQEQAEQEPVGRWNWNEAKFEWLTKFDYYKHHMTPLYAAPLAQQDTHATHVVRTKDLTDDEIVSLINSVWFLDELMVAKVNFARAVIAADREKNK